MQALAGCGSVVVSVADSLSNSKRGHRGDDDSTSVATVGSGERTLFRIAHTFVWLLLLAPPLLLALDPQQWPLYLALGIVSNLLFSYSAVRSNCTWFGPVVTRFQTGKKEVWLTIDDGPHPQDTPRLLALLKRHGARATFFVVGRHVEQYPELALAMVRDGHQLANHSATHPVASFWCLPTSRLAREVDGCAQTLRKTTAAASRRFRAPAGMANLFLHFLLRERGMKLIGWSARGYDGLRHNVEPMVTGILESVEPGAIILLHEGKLDGHGNSVSLLVIETLLKRLTLAGYSFTVPSDDRLL